MNWLLTRITTKIRVKTSKKRSKKPSKHYLLHKEKARALIAQKVAHFNTRYNFKYNRIFIKNQKTKWGSCSSNKNLNFNYKIIFLPEELINYIVVHELCHLKELNHSKNFWVLVAQIFPNYKALNKHLKTFGNELSFLQLSDSSRRIN